MCRKVLAGLLIIAVSLGFKAKAQQYAFQVTFTDKNNTPYSFSDPLAFLSARSLQRRANQGISLDSTDFPVNAAYVDSVLTLTGGKLHGTSRWLNMCMVLISAADSSQITNLSGKPYISNIKLVGYYDPDLQRRALIHPVTGRKPSAQKTATTDEAYYGDTWVQTTQVNGNYLFDHGYKGQNMLIAVLDAGFIGTNTHSGFDSMWQAGRMVDTFNFVYDNTGVFSQDDHGTQVLSTMAGYVPDTFVGTAPLAMYALYVTEYDPNDQPLELDNMICAAERADSLGADVITESLGYDLFANPADGQVFSQLDGKTTVGAMAANIATKKGILFVATAGNDGTPVPGWGNHILTPGDADSALTIGAVDNSGVPANFSGYGPNAAGRIKPDVSAMGENAAIFDYSGGYTTGNGTSFSTPQIAGWAACLWQENRDVTPYQLRQAIITCASQYTSPGDQIGYGIPNFGCTEESLLNINDPVLNFTLAHWVFATPNPFDNALNISVSPDTDGIVKFHIYDMAGKEIIAREQYFSKGFNTPLTLSVAYLPPGIYILRAVSATQSQVLKLEKY